MQIQKLNVVKEIDEKDFPYYEGKGFRKVKENPDAENTTPALLCDEKQCEDALRAEAKALGLKPHHAAKSETIRKMIAAAKAAEHDG